MADSKRDEGTQGEAEAERQEQPVRCCERCRAEIAPARLTAIPETRLCIACSQATGGEFTLQVVPENVAKAGSLKKNYGSWDVQRVRRPIRTR